MTTTVDDRGLINNLPNEPQAYAVAGPTASEKRSYWVMGIAGALLMAGVVMVAVWVS